MVREWAKDCEYYLFIGKKGCKLDRTAVYRVIKRACRELGIEGNTACHSFRKSLAFHMYRQTKDIALIQKVLNHSNSAVSLTYIGVLQDEIDNAYLNLDMNLGINI